MRHPFLHRRPRSIMPAPLAVALAALGLATFGLVSASAAAAQSNLLTNGNFASGSTAGWTCSSADTVVTSPTYQGSSYALAGTPSAGDDAQCTQTVSVQPSSQYTLTGWVEGAYVFLGDTGTGTNDTDNWIPSAPAWTQLSISFTTGSATTSVTVYIHGWYAQPTFYADNLSLTGPAGSGGGGGTQPPAAPTNLTVTGTTSSSVSLSWTAPSGTVTGYYVYENGAQTQTVTGTSTTVTGLAATTYTFTVAAYNSSGQSSQSNQVSATTSSSGGGGGGNLPAHLMMGYWQDFTNGAKPLTLAAVPTSYNLIAVAFGNADSTPGQVTFALDSGLSSALGGYTQQQFIADIATLHSRGQKVILSVGGQNGTISVSDGPPRSGSGCRPRPPRRAAAM